MLEIWTAEATAKGNAVGKAEMTLTFLQTKFKKISEEIEKAIRQMSNPAALDSLAVSILNCETLDEFLEELRWRWQKFVKKSRPPLDGLKSACVGKTAGRSVDFLKNL